LLLNKTATVTRAGLLPRNTPTPRPTLRSNELGPRDRLSQAFVHELTKGRTWKPHKVAPASTVDLAASRAELIDTNLPFVAVNWRDYHTSTRSSELVPRATRLALT